MAILKLKLDVTKLDKTAFFKGEKGTYVDLAVFINDEPDQYGNHASVKQDLGKDRRDEKRYVGNGKWVTPPTQAQPTKRQSTSRPMPEGDDFEQIPF